MARKDDLYYDLRVYHFAAKFDAHGNVSALCYKRPHAIDMDKGQRGVLIAKSVTCPRCRKLLKAMTPAQEA